MHCLTLNQDAPENPSQLDVGKCIRDRLLTLVHYIAQTVPLSLPCVLSKAQRLSIDLPEIIPGSDLYTMTKYLNTLKHRLVVAFVL